MLLREWFSRLIWGEDWRAWSELNRIDHALADAVIWGDMTWEEADKQLKEHAARLGLA